MTATASPASKGGGQFETVVRVELQFRQQVAAGNAEKRTGAKRQRVAEHRRVAAGKAGLRQNKTAPRQSGLPAQTARSRHAAKNVICRRRPSRSKRPSHRMVCGESRQERRQGRRVSRLPCATGCDCGGQRQSVQQRVETSGPARCRSRKVVWRICPPACGCALRGRRGSCE